MAAIDIGTNTVLLLIAEVRGGELIPLREQAEIVRLGEGVDQTRELNVAAAERTLVVLRRYGEELRAHEVDRAAAVGTQALREVSRGGAFIAAAREALGCNVEVIAGDREARLCWRAVAAAFPRLGRGRRTVLDIGGGSTELLVGGEQIERLASVPIGSVRLTERLLEHDPPTEEERHALRKTIDAALATLPTPEGQLIAVAGTVTTLCAISLGLADYDGARVHGQRLVRTEIDRIVTQLGDLSLEERKRTPGLDPRRADVIYAGGVILSRVMARGSFDEVVVSDRGIRWGLAHELAHLAT